VFEVFGPYGLFRKPYSPLSPVSYPFPPPPTVMGMIGAICGYGKDEYLEKVGWSYTRIGIEIRSPIKKYRAGINLINTKEKPFYRLSGENPRIQIPHEFLKDISYRIFVAEGPQGMMNELTSHLESGTNSYNLSLGLEQCIGGIRFVGIFEAFKKTEDQHDINTVIPTEKTEKVVYSAEGRYGHYRIPVRMNPERKVLEYKVALAEESANPVKAISGHVYLVGNDNVTFF